MAKFSIYLHRRVFVMEGMFSYVVAHMMIQSIKGDLKPEQRKNTGSIMMVLTTNIDNQPTNF